ncbi:MAG: hypothetical protein V2B19_13935 [Pseudomonadota bacterium]
MKSITLKTFVVAALFTLMATGGTIVQAGTLEGIVQGYGCVTVEKLCAVDRMDPRLTAERNFVVIAKDGTPYFITNVDSAILAENILNQIRITGDVNGKYKTVEADKVELFNNGRWNEVWSMKMEKEQREILNWGT